MHVMLSRHVNPMIKNTEIKTAFLWLELLPRHGHEDRIDTHGRQLRNDRVCLSRRSSRGITQFAAQNQKWASIYDKLPGPVLHPDAWQPRSMQSCNKKRKANDIKNCSIRG